MKFLMDANVRYSVGYFLQSLGHDVHWIANTTQHNLSDKDVLALAVKENRIVVTNDKDFGQLVVRQHLDHNGIILFRLSSESRLNYQKHIEVLLDMYGDRLLNRFVVITDEHVRMR